MVGNVSACVAWTCDQFKQHSSPPATYTRRHRRTDGDLPVGRRRAQCVLEPRELCCARVASAGCRAT
eukprot:46817-Eustigmatos_ZCMA.PRE.1